MRVPGGLEDPMWFHGGLEDLMRDPRRFGGPHEGPWRLQACMLVHPGAPVSERPPPMMKSQILDICVRLCFATFPKIYCKSGGVYCRSHGWD